MATTTHAKYSPSTLKSYRACPGYLPRDDGESDASLEGSFLHALVEHEMDEEKARAERPEFARVELTAERLQWAQLAHDYVMGLIEAAGPKVKVVREEWLSLKFLKLKGCEGGTADLIIICPDGTAHLVDFKFGWREVDAIQDEGGALQNLQFMSYGLAALEKYREVHSVMIHMVQPKLEGVDVGMMTRDDVDHVSSLITGVVKACLKYEQTKDASMLRPDEELCSWCGRIATCEKWVGGAVAVAQLGARVGIPDSEKEFDPELIPERFTGWDVDTADPVEVAKMMKMMAPLESFIKHFKRFALDVYQSGKDVPGYSEVSSGGKSSVISPIDAAQVMEEKFGVSTAEFIGACEVSLDALRKLASAKAEKGQKGKVAEAVVDALSDEGLIDRAPSYSYLKATRSKVVD